MDVSAWVIGLLPRVGRQKLKVIWYNKRVNNINIPELFKKLDKQLVWSIAVGALVLGVAVFLYLGGVFEKKIFSGSDIEITCEDFGSLLSLEQENYDRRLDEIFAMKQLTKKDLEILLPEGCYVVNPRIKARIVPGSCLVLEEQYCNDYEEREFNGYPARAFNLPQGTPIFAPFAGAFFIEEPSWSSPFKAAYLVLEGFPSSAVVVGDIQPRLRFGQGMKEGDWVATVSSDPDSINTDGGFNVFIYTIDYAIENLF
mgnify:CR=1 FL=1